jgi:hypothetical protein
MATTSVTAKIRETLDIHGYLTSAITHNHVLFLYDFTKSIDVITIQIFAVHGVGKILFIENFPG